MLYALTYVVGNQYLLMDGKEVIKVGYSDNWDKRIQDYAYGYYHPKNGYTKKGDDQHLKLFTTIFDDYANRGAETIIHRALRKHRACDTQKCEWYVVSEQFKNDLSSLLQLNIVWDKEPYIPKIYAETRMADHNHIALKWLKDNLKAGQKIERDVFIDQLDVTNAQKQSLRDALKKSGLKRRKELHQSLNNLNIEIISKPGRYGSTFIYKHGKTTKTKSPQLPVINV